MDIILNIYDHYILSPFFYPNYWTETDISRQFLSLMIIVSTHSILLYLAVSGSVYYFVFDKSLTKSPKYLKVIYLIV
jgi:hypothetical protein